MLKPKMVIQCISMLSPISKIMIKQLAWAKEWLATVGEDGATVTGEECQFCHTQGAPEP